MSQWYALLHRGGGSALSHTAYQGRSRHTVQRRMTLVNALQSNMLARRQRNKQIDISDTDIAGGELNSTGLNDDAVAAGHHYAVKTASPLSLST